MLDANNKVIYVGKAKSLKNRVNSYFTGAKDTKTSTMVALIADIQITVTNNETEALLLEFQLIKKQKPKYNVIFRDGKSYPYIHLTAHQYPRLMYYRGNALAKGKFFGPYPSNVAVRESLELLYKVFNIRSCTDSYFNNRSRPCLQYQIKRCSAPCVGAISNEEYAEDVKNVISFLVRKEDSVIKDLNQKMDHASVELRFELAARLRDQINALRKLQKSQSIVSNKNEKVDVIGVAIMGQYSCVHLLTIRDGKILGSEQYFPENQECFLDNLAEEFLLQHYLAMPESFDFPKEIVFDNCESQSFDTSIITSHSGFDIKINNKPIGIRNKWLQIANQSARSSLSAKLSMNAEYFAMLEELSQTLNINIASIICFDISHTGGKDPYGVSVALDAKGFTRSEYRRYKIKEAKAHDDYGAMFESLQKHFNSLIKRGKPMPDCLLIDGGVGQLNVAKKVVQEIGIEICLIGICKGDGRAAKNDKIFFNSGSTTLELNTGSDSRRLLQLIRDEAHRYAISTHRRARGSGQIHSILCDIEGVGPAKRKELLQKFGGLSEIKEACVEELASVKGISLILAKRIFDALHKDV